MQTTIITTIIMATDTNTAMVIEMATAMATTTGKFNKQKNR